MKFRISGKGVSFFGDGLALFLTKKQPQSTGRFYGSAGNYHGISIAFDTFKNQEKSDVHKDISIFFNDGSKDITDEVVSVPGCNAAFRYSENRNDFNVKTRVKL